MYDAWPFRPFQQHFVDDAQTWWANCYLPGAVESLLLDSAHWVLIDGEPGSGKTVTLHALQHHLAKTTFFVPYPPNRWPGAKDALKPDENSHLWQMMANAGLVVRDFLNQYPEKVGLLSKLQREFLRWFLEQHLGGRTFHVLTLRLPPDLGEEFRAVPQNEALYTTDSPLDVQGQIDELVCLVQTFGFQRLIFIVDINDREEGIHLTNGLAALFGWLELMHHPGFAVATAIPTILLQESNIEARARHRLRRISLHWEEADCRLIAERHMQQALADEAVCLSVYAGEEVLAEVGKVIVTEYGRSVPAGWVALAETLLHLASNSNLPFPLQKNHLPQVKQAFYSRHMPIRLDMAAHGLWRGPRFIGLDDQPLEFINLLLQRRGHPINWDDNDLRLLAVTKNNVHSIASRTRKAIEPIPKQPVYLINKRGEGGYWLENYVEP